MAVIFSESFTTIGPWTYSASTLDPDSPRIIRKDDSTPLGSSYPEQIASEANYPDGLGGLGHLSWRGDGSNQQSNNLVYRWLSDEPLLYIRYYIKFEAGMTFSNGYSKDLDFEHGTSARVIFGCQDVSFGFWHSTGGYLWESGYTWADMMGGSSASDGQWHCIEPMMKYGVGDGELHLWIDGVDRGGATGLTFPGAAGGWQGFTLWNNQDSIGGPGGPYKMYFDDLVVDNASRVGPISTGSVVVGKGRHYGIRRARMAR